MAGVGLGSKVYKPLRPSQIIKPLRPSQIIKREKLVQSVMTVVNPFDDNIYKDDLYHLSSGVPLADDHSVKMLLSPAEGVEFFEEFLKTARQFQKCRFPSTY